MARDPVSRFSPQGVSHPLIGAIYPFGFGFSVLFNVLQGITAGVLRPAPEQGQGTELSARSRSPPYRSLWTPGAADLSAETVLLSAFHTTDTRSQLWFAPSPLHTGAVITPCECRSTQTFQAGAHTDNVVELLLLRRPNDRPAAWCEPTDKALRQPKSGEPGVAFHRLCPPPSRRCRRSLPTL